MAATKKATPTKKKTTPKKVTSKKTAKSTKRRPVFAIRIDNETSPFLTFRLTRQTLYWVIFSAAILALGVWVLFLNIKLIEIYDQIQLNDAITESLSTPLPKKAAQ